MGLGRRSAPTAPPIPSRPLPPSAYGIAVPGAPVVPGQQQQFAPPPPPSAPPAGTPSPFATYAPPTPLPPAIEYGAAAPSEASASRFGGYAGPPDAFAAPPATPFGAPPVQYGTPTWSTQPPKKQGSRLWAKVVGGLVTGAVGLVVLLHVFVAATAHHITVLPQSVNGATLDTSPQIQAVEAATIAQAQQSDGHDRLRHFQIGVYRDGNSLIVAGMADIPANSPAFRSTLLNQMLSGQGISPTSVTPGRQGGSESCGNSTNGVGCVWVDNGTFGMLVVPGADVPTVEAYLQTFRDQVER